MHFSSHEKLGVIIDGSNTHATVRALGYDIDYKRLQSWLGSQGRLVASEYYTAILPAETESSEYVSLRPLVDWLQYNGWRVTTLEGKLVVNDHGRRHVRSSIMMELAMGMIRMARYADHIVLVSGTGDLRPVVAEVQRQGVRVSVASSVKSMPPMVSDDLRRQADQFLELDDLKDDIGRLGPRPVRTRTEAAE